MPELANSSIICSISFHAEGVGAMGKAPSPRRYSSIICCLACLQAASWGAFSTAPPTRIESANALEIPSMSCSSNSAILAERSSPLWSSRPLSRAKGQARIRGGPWRLQGRWTGCGPKKLLCFHPGRLRAAWVHQLQDASKRPQTWLPHEHTSESSPQIHLQRRRSPVSICHSDYCVERPLATMSAPAPALHNARP